MATKRKSPDERLVPVWFQLPSRFYKKLASVAEECGTSQADVIKRGISLVLNEHRGLLSKTSASQNGDSAAVRLGKLRWKDVSDEERRKLARELAKKRWGKSST